MSVNDNTRPTGIGPDVAAARLTEAHRTLDDFEREVEVRRRQLMWEIHLAEVDHACHDGKPYDVSIEAAMVAAKWICRDYPAAQVWAAKERHHRGRWPKVYFLPTDEEVRNNPMKWLVISQREAKIALNRCEWRRLNLSLKGRHRLR